MFSIKNIYSDFRKIYKRCPLNAVNRFRSEALLGWCTRESVPSQCLKQLQFSYSVSCNESTGYSQCYIQYSNIAARVLRQALKPNIRADALKREESHVKFTQWKDGKPIKTSSPPSSS